MRTLILVLGLVLTMSPSAFAQSVGVAAAVNQSAVGIAPGKAAKTVFLGDQIIHDQKITTDGKGLLQILLADGTSFTVGPNSSLTIDSFVYDPDKGTAKVVASVGTGLFRFIGGATSKTPGGATINTPVGTVGILGGISNLDFSGAVPNHIDMVYGQSVTLKDGTQVVGDLYHSGYSIVIGANGKVGVEKTPPEWTQLFQQALAGNGKGGNVTGSQVKNSVGGSNNTNNSNSNSNPPAETEVANTETPITTWGQINNSDLNGVDATYGGTYLATLSGCHACEQNELADENGQASGRFELDYAFYNRQGTAYFGEVGAGAGDDIHDDPSLAISVVGNTGLGPTQLSADPNQTSGFDGHGATGNATLNGFFLNTPDGVGRGVAGTFSGTVVNGEDSPFGGSYTLSGAFGGNLSSIYIPGSD